MKIASKQLIVFFILILFLTYLRSDVEYVNIMNGISKFVDYSSQDDSVSIIKSDVPFITMKEPNKSISYSETPTSTSPTLRTTLAPTINIFPLSDLNISNAFSKLLIVTDKELESYIKTQEYVKSTTWVPDLPKLCLTKNYSLIYSPTTTTTTFSHSVLEVNKTITIPVLLFHDRIDYINILMETELIGKIHVKRKRNDVYLFGRFVGTHVFGLSFQRINPNDDMVLTANVSFPLMGGNYSLSIITAINDPISKVGGIRLYQERQEIGSSTFEIMKLNYSKGSITNQVYYSLSSNLTEKLKWDDLIIRPDIDVRAEMQYMFSDGSKYDRTCLSRHLNDMIHRVNNKTSKTNEKICLVGDSHVRFLGLEMRFAVENIDFKGSWKGTSQYFAYRLAHYGDEIKDALTTITTKYNCSIILMGIGQWQLSSKQNPNRYYSVNKYGRELVRFFEWWKNTIEIVKIPLLWLSIEPCTGSYVYLTDPTNINLDWRHPSFIETWNLALQSLLNRYNVGYFSSYEYLFPIQEFTKDHCHFGRPQLDAVIDSLLVNILSRIL